MIKKDEEIDFGADDFNIADDADGICEHTSYIQLVNMYEDNEDTISISLQKLCSDGLFCTYGRGMILTLNIKDMSELSRSYWRTRVNTTPIIVSEIPDQVNREQNLWVVTEETDLSNNEIKKIASMIKSYVSMIKDVRKEEIKDVS